MVGRVTHRLHDEDVIEVPSPACRNCHQGKSAHVEGQCLFDSTTWDPMTDEEHAKWVREEVFGHITTVTGRLSSREPNVQNIRARRK